MMKYNNTKQTRIIEIRNFTHKKRNFKRIWYFVTIQFINIFFFIHYIAIQRKWAIIYLLSPLSRVMEGSDKKKTTTGTDGRMEYRTGFVIYFFYCVG